jgi:hypothetical protein
MLGTKVFGYSLNFFNLLRERRKAMNKRAIKPVLVFALLIAFASFAIAQMAGKGWEKTVTPPSGEVIMQRDARGYC